MVISLGTVTLDTATERSSQTTFIIVHTHIIAYLSGVEFKRLLSLPFALDLGLNLPEERSLCKL